MENLDQLLKTHPFFKPISETEKHCEKHGLDYLEQVFKAYTKGCPKCAEEAEAERKQKEIEKVAAERQAALQKQIEGRIGASKIPPRFVGKTVKLSLEGSTQGVALRYLETLERGKPILLAQSGITC